MHPCHRLFWCQRIQTSSDADFTFTVDSLPVVWSQRPPVVMQMPSAHRPSEKGAVNAMLLLQPLSTDSACQLLQNTPLLSTLTKMLEAKRSERQAENVATSQMPPPPAHPSSPTSAAPALPPVPPDGWWWWWCCVTAACTRCPVMSQSKLSNTVFTMSTFLL